MSSFTALFRKDPEPRLVLLTQEQLDNPPDFAESNPSSGGFLETLCKIVEFVAFLFTGLFGKSSEIKDELSLEEEKELFGEVEPFEGEGPFGEGPFGEGWLLGRVPSDDPYKARINLGQKQMEQI